MRPPPPTKTEKKTKEKKKSKERPPAPTRPQDSEPAIMQPDQDLPPAYAPAVRFWISQVMYCTYGEFPWANKLQLPEARHLSGLGLSRLPCIGFGVVVEDSYYNIRYIFVCLMKFFSSLASNVYYIVFHTWAAVLAGNPLLLLARLVILGCNNIMIKLLVYDMKFFLHSQIIFKMMS